MTAKEFVNYVVEHKGKTFCTLCEMWHKNQDTYKPCCYEHATAGSTLIHLEDLAIKILINKENE